MAAVSAPSRHLLTLLALLPLALLHLWLAADLAPFELWTMLASAEHSFEFLQLQLSALPRLSMALLTGAALGLSGSLLQQITQNRLVSPMTIGASSGAWLGLVLATLLVPTFAASHGHWAALLGALVAVGLVLLIAGRSGIGGLPLVLGGMAMNLLLGALAAGLVLINNQYTQGLFVWGAGDLAQIDWHWVQWLWPKLLLAVPVLILAPRPLSLLQLGGDAAQGRGLALWPVMLVLFLAALWLCSVSITAVGLIGFIGLLTPNLAKMLGARTARDELFYSALLGALLLLGTDALALLANRLSGQLVPSGAAAALIGAPVLLWLARRHLAAEDPRGLQLPRGAERFGWRSALWVALLAVLALTVALGLARGVDGWHLQWPSALVWSLRWPRVLTAASAGAGLAISGLLLQRLLRNPLASPDILGLSAGATLAVMLALIIFGGALLGAVAPLAAFVGSLAVLAVLMLLGRRHHYSPALMALLGISLGALLNAALQFVLAKGTGDSFALLGWLAGSTYRATPAQALWLTVGVLLFGALAVLFQRGLTLIGIGDGVAASRGLNVPRLRLVLLVLVALLCALVTSLLGPVAFLGLLAPHIAVMLGARRVLPQLLLAASLGAVLMLLADWVGRTLIFPLQIPVGIVASVLCGSYFVYLLIRGRLA
ncbi:Fe(3+)-hydroxamate ABC transporter permease FhuB [Ectopseudomonas oleovorans]|uniref:Ferrichrome transport system permease protein fhuB n=1 Tax=Ectopseudomonas oleovorans (strain CECT 5344) TaxID=1182590 RepID=W6QYZ2_ECTO5|nr:Fe(3+)-hydroxamate ABC transporter permease FhuB [Pseudomonas oleovorans]PZQ43380.1 MAG: Fe(3+)-hydroxamate ABC transporter permease FhuB [Pseudomonas oleovorans]CDM39366.1 Ferrichrome transport system permease protein fhuB [Pseudomonas oleovorans CECT 5344]CDR89987.1 Ferrichrome transport system permease protein fhuB [Pseudomonas oleovorans]